MKILASRHNNLTTTSDYLSRLDLIRVILVIFTCVLFYRLLDLQILNPDNWQERGDKQHLGKITLAAERGKILDRYNREIAISIPAHSLFIRPREVQEKDKSQLISKVAVELDMSEETILNKLNSKSPFVWIKRQLPRYRADQVLALEFDGIGTVEESKRLYPYAEAGSVLIGKVGVDGHGLSGLEARFEKHLSPDSLKVFYQRDALGNRILSENFDSNQVKGDDLQLTIDAELQSFASQELQALVEEHQAKSALALLVDASTGEVLTLAQAPAVNFNQEKITSRQAFFNMAIQGAYEPGSTFKPLVAALALDAGTTKMDKVYNTENGRFRIGRRTVKDVHAYDHLSVKEIIVHSSNIGMSKIAYEMGAKQLYQGLKKYGFGTSSGLGFQGESAGILRPVSKWAEIDVATHSFGQGVAVTPVQLVRAFAALVNGGRLPDLQIISQKENHLNQVVQVISPEVSQQMTEALQAVVTDGTGKNAAIKGLLVGGKTGTAQKARTDGKGYEPNAYIASFLGYADGSPIGVDKKYVLLVMADEPRGRSIYGGTVSAPTFKSIMEYAFYQLKVRESLGKEI